MGVFFLAGMEVHAQARPESVTDAVFRSRWEGLQADRRGPRSVGGLAELQPGDPNYGYLESTADALLSGLSIGPVNVNVGLSAGWEYSSRDDEGPVNTASDDNSWFLAPSLNLRYDREIGPWSVSTNYAVGYRYYLNPEYTAAGTGDDRNPLNQTAAVSIGHLGARHELTLRGSASSGTGFDVLAGENLIQTTVGASMDYRYMLTSFLDIGADARYSVLLSGQEEDGGNTGDGDFGDVEAGTWVEWLATGKTRLRWEIGAGQSSQTLQNEERAARNFVQTLVSVAYTPTEKLSFQGGIGLAYLNDQGIQDGEDIGIQPRYLGSVRYEPTEKTFLTAGLSLLGADIRPDFRLEAGWQPRVNTGLSLALYQNQGFSITTSEQVQVSRGIIGTVSQRLFSKVALTLSGGWQETENVNLSGESLNPAGENQTYTFVTASLIWQVNDWSSWSAAWWNNSGGTLNQGSGNSPETRVTVSFNLTF
jgi:hypothetical protein